MISRRTWLGTAAAGWLTSACASHPGRSWHGSLAQVLNILPSIGTAPEFIEEFGEPYDRKVFSHDDPDNDYFPNRYPRDAWKRAEVATPPDLIDALPIGTGMLLYHFKYGSALNPSGGLLFICVDATDRVVGWFYSRDLIGYESEARLVE
jgi:hypothetical protein